MSAKDLIVKIIDSKTANLFIKRNHYSGKIVNNSKLHFGVFIENSLHGVMSFGSALDKRKMLGLVKNTQWNDFLELNRMAFDEKLPRNSESRALSIAFKLIKKNAPHIKWIISFADGTQCGDGIIYRASGFYLIGIKKSFNLCRLTNGQVIHKMTLESNPLAKREELNGKTYYDITGGIYNFKKYVNFVNAEILEGFQLKYIYFLDKQCLKNLTVPIIPFSKIKEVGAGMYKGIKKNE